MKYLIVSLLVLVGCTEKAKVIHSYTATACDRDGCKVLKVFTPREFETDMDVEDRCKSFLKGLHYLHIELRKEKPAKLNDCDEN